jgi:hypothetical protein
MYPKWTLAAYGRERQEISKETIQERGRFFQGAYQQQAHAEHKAVHKRTSEVGIVQDVLVNLLCRQQH